MSPRPARAATLPERAPTSGNVGTVAAQDATRALEALARALVPLLVPHLVAQLSHETSDDDYTSTSLPHGVTRRTFREVLASGAVRDAVREGAVWRCTRDAWHDARARRPRRRAPLTLLAPPATSLEAEADELLERSGLVLATGARVVNPSHTRDNASESGAKAETTKPQPSKAGAR